MTSTEEVEEQEEATRQSVLARLRANKPLRIALFLSAIGALWLYAHMSGMTEGVTPLSIRDKLRAAGWIGMAGYIASFSLGNIVQIPGLIFLLGGLLTYGPVQGGALALIASLAAITTSFVVARTVGGQVDIPEHRPRVRKVLQQLDDKPLRTMVVLRILFWTSPPLNYILAFSPVRYRQYITAAAIGMVPPIIGLALLTDQIMKWRGWT
jgi:uncharacterized membrane protein YdjX (TVP38/TMEM64 family)